MPAPAWPARDAAHLLVSSRQMSELEAQLFASGLPVEALMEKAALAVARRLLQNDWGPPLRERVEVVPHLPVAVERLAMQRASGEPLEKVVLLTRRQTTVVLNEPFCRGGFHDGVE